MKHFYADSLGFLDLPGKPPVGDINLSEPDGANINLIHLTSAPPWLKTTEYVLKTHREFVRTLDKQFPDFKIIKNKNELEPFEDRISRCIAIVLGLQNTPEDILENNNLKVLYDEGIRIMALAYEDKNSFGGGCMAPQTHLTEKGMNLLHKFQENNMILDISHSGLKTAYSVNYLFPRLSVFASHSGCYDIYMHNRNITDHTMRNIVENGGVIGIPTLNFILSKDDDSISGFLKHIKHAVYLVGEDNVCVGSDGVYKKFSIEELMTHHEIIRQNIKSEYQD